jgi:SAM-dependent methyltransferase
MTSRRGNNVLAGAENERTDDPMTHWEGINQFRWGRYLSREEERLVRRASDMGKRTLTPPFTALDIGCEGGRWAHLLRDEGWSVSATDVDASSLATCSTRLPDVACILMNAADTRLPMPDASQSLVVCIEVAPVVNSTWLFPEATRVVRVGGLLALVMWNRRSLRGAVVAAESRLRGRPNEFYRHSYAERRRRLSSAGFAVVEDRGLCWFPFRRTSDSRLVPVATTLERLLGLDRLTGVSPWVLLLARRCEG